MAGSKQGNTMQRIHVHLDGTELAATTDKFVMRLKSGEVTLITGPNGVGKSALLDEVYRATSGMSERLTGFRQIHFQSSDIDDVGLNSEHLRSNLGHYEAYSRYRNSLSEQHLKSYMRRFREAILQSLNDSHAIQQNGVSFEIARQHHPSPLNMLNSIFRAALLPIEIVVQAGALHAERAGVRYSVDRMSDGERSALLMVSAALVQARGNCFIVDEPERHLNPAIAAPLISAMVRARPDLIYVFSTHDASLIEALQPTAIVHIRNSAVEIPSPESRVYDLQHIQSPEELPADVKVSLLGSRKSLLLTEGTDNSDDRALYSILYPGWQVLARGGNQSVSAEVPAINAHGHYTWLRVAGLIDGDGRTVAERKALEEKQVFSLPCPTIENLYFLRNVVEEMSAHIVEFIGGEAAHERLSSAYSVARKEVERCRDEIAARRAAWLVNRLLSEKKISVLDVRKGLEKVDEIDVVAIKGEIERDLDDQLNSLDPALLLFSVPIKNSKVPAKVCEALGFNNFRQYKDAVLSQMEQRTPRGVRIAGYLSAAMPTF